MQRGAGAGNGDKAGGEQSDWASDRPCWPAGPWGRLIVDPTLGRYCDHNTSRKLPVDVAAGVNVPGKLTSLLLETSRYQKQLRRLRDKVIVAMFPALEWGAFWKKRDTEEDGTC